MTSKLEKIRVSRGLSQRRLEGLSGIKQQQISLMEKGLVTINFTQARRLAKALDCQPSDVVDIDAGYNKLSKEELQNVHKYLQATFDLTDISLKKTANLLNMDVSELKDFGNDSTDLTVDNGLLLAFVALLPLVAQKISATLNSSQSISTDDTREKEVIEAFRALTEDEKERFIHLIKATPLLK